MPNNPLRLELSVLQKKELFSFMKSTRDKEGNTKGLAVKKKREEGPIEESGKNVGVNRGMGEGGIKIEKMRVLGEKEEKKEGGKKTSISS